MGEGHAQQAVQALAAGATACVARPYRVPELLPLVQAAFTGESGIRRMLVVGKVELDMNAYQVKVDGRTVHLPLREFELLHYLMRNAHRTVTREQIMRHVWNSTDTTSTNTIAVHVKRLRARLGDNDDQLIQTVRRRGLPPGRQDLLRLSRKRPDRSRPVGGTCQRAHRAGRSTGPARTRGASARSTGCSGRP